MADRIQLSRCTDKVTAFVNAKSKDCSSIAGVHQCKGCKKNAFKIIFNFGLAIGLPLSASGLANGQQEIGKNCKIWCISLYIIRTILLLFSLAYMYQFFPATSTRITVYGFSVSGYIIMIFFSLNRKKIYISTRNLCHLSTVMNPETFIGGRHILLQTATLISIVISLIVLIVMFFYLQELAKFREVIYIPSAIPEDFKEFYLNFVVLCIILSFSCSVYTCGIAFLLSRNMYKVLANVTRSFEQVLKDRSCGTSWPISEDITTFKNISFRTHEVDESVGMSVFFLYVFVMSGFFNTVSVMVINNDPSLRTPASLAYVAWAFLTSTLILLELSRQGTCIIGRVEDLKRQMVECSDKIARSLPTKQTMDVFNLLFEVVMKSNMSVTGGGMFTINYGLVLAIGGTLVTYGVLILQLDGKQ